MLPHLLGYMILSLFFAYLCSLPFLAYSTGRGKTMGEYYSKLIKMVTFKMNHGFFISWF